MNGRSNREGNTTPLHYSKTTHVEAQKFPARDLLAALRPNRLGFDELPRFLQFPLPRFRRPPKPSPLTTARHLQQLKLVFPGLRPPPEAARLGQMAAPVGDPGQVRIINGHEIVFGKRSKCDAKSWSCEGCGKTNEPRRMLIFDIPRFRCQGCGKPFPGDFDMCLANVKVNKIPLMGDLKCQGADEDECIAYALAYMVEMIYKIDCALNCDDLSVDELAKLKSIFMDTTSLSGPYNTSFHASLLQYPGIHKLLHLCQKLKQQGVLFQVQGEEMAKENSVGFQVGEIQIVHSFDFEEVCEQIADGNPLIATLTTGSDYRDLKYCEFYTGVTTLEFDTALARHRDVASHVVLLIGAASIGGNKGFYGLDAQGNVFCPQFAPDESWSVASRLTEGTVHYVTESSTVPSFAESSTAPALKKQKREPVCAGFGKINAETEFRMNFIKFARHGEEGSYAENLKLLNEDESSTDVLEHNMNLMYDGEYFDTRSRIVGTKLREMGLLRD